MTKYILILLTLISNVVYAQSNSELANSRQRQEYTKSNGIKWINNLCVKASDNKAESEIIYPLSRAIKTCTQRRSYAEISKAYSKYERENFPLLYGEIDNSMSEIICTASYGDISLKEGRKVIQTFMAEENPVIDEIPGMKISFEPDVYFPAIDYVDKILKVTLDFGNNTVVGAMEIRFKGNANSGLINLEGTMNGKNYLVRCY